MYKQKLSFRDTLAKNYINAVGWSTKRKLILIESDDWGAIRMPSKTIYNDLTQACGNKGCFFDQLDSLETPDDLNALYEVLSSITDSKGNNVVFQPYAVVANPNYEAIEQNGFHEYIFEPFTETFKRYSQTSKSFSVIKEGINAGIWHPQSHGREHINVNRWIKCLQNPKSLTRAEFALHAFHGDCCPANCDYYSAFDYDTLDENNNLKLVLKEGLDMFEQLYGYRSISFCAPCGIIKPELMDFLSTQGVKLGSGQMHYPKSTEGYDVKNHFWGHKGVNGMLYYRRNCKFEPARDHNLDWIDRCMSEIEIAFRWGKPAVIDSHRVNYIGSIDESNRTDTLHKLSSLLKTIKKRWPNAEFVTNEELYKEMTK